jgi:hypothetical protein
MDVAQLTSRFAALLETAGSKYKGGVVVTIDALDELQEEHRAHELAWLPRLLPAGACLIMTTVSAQPGCFGDPTRCATSNANQPCLSHGWLTG